MFLGNDEATPSYNMRAHVRYATHEIRFPGYDIFVVCGFADTEPHGVGVEE